MPSTQKYGLRYPALADPANVPLDMQRLAEDSEAALDQVKNALLAILGNVQGITVGHTYVTPVANTPTVGKVSGLTTPGTNHAAFVTANTSVPGIVQMVSSGNVTATTFDIFVLRSNTTNTGVFWAHVGYR